MTACISIEVHRQLGETHFSPLKGQRVRQANNQLESSSFRNVGETSTEYTAPILEDSILHTHRCENLKFDDIILIFTLTQFLETV
jgi:hypothetical protein